MSRPTDGREARRALVVERAQAHIGAHTRGLERHRGGDDVVQIRRVAYALNVFLLNHPGHVA